MWLSAGSHTGTSAETGRKHQLKGVNYQQSHAIIKVHVCFGYEDNIAVPLMRRFTLFSVVPACTRNRQPPVSQTHERFDTLPSSVSIKQSAGPGTYMCFEARSALEEFIALL